MKSRSDTTAADLDIYPYMHHTYWGYDNGWNYEGEYRDAYHGPDFGKDNFLILLYKPGSAVVIHHIQDKKKKVLDMPVYDTESLLSMLQTAEEYRNTYCDEISIDPDNSVPPPLIQISGNGKHSHLIKKADLIVAALILLLIIRALQSSPVIPISFTYIISCLTIVYITARIIFRVLSSFNTVNSYANFLSFYYDDYAFLMKDNYYYYEYGLLFRGKILLPCTYRRLWRLQCGYFAVDNGKATGLYFHNGTTEDGRFLIKPGDYRDVSSLAKKAFLLTEQSGRKKIFIQNKFAEGFFGDKDTVKAELIETCMDHEFTHLYLVSVNNKYGLIKSNRDKTVWLEKPGREKEKILKSAHKFTDEINSRENPYPLSATSALKEQWLRDARKTGALFLFIVHDSFDRHDSPVCVMPHEDADEIRNKYNSDMVYITKEYRFYPE